MDPLTYFSMAFVLLSVVLHLPQMRRTSVLERRVAAIEPGRLAELDGIVTRAIAAAEAAGDRDLEERCGRLADEEVLRAAGLGEWEAAGSSGNMRQRQSAPGRPRLRLYAHMHGRPRWEASLSETDSCYAEQERSGWLPEGSGWLAAQAAAERAAAAMLRERAAH